MTVDWLSVALALAVLVVPMLLAWALLGWNDRRDLKRHAKDNAADNRPSLPIYRKHGKHL